MNSLICDADVVSNLLESPTITINGSKTQTESNSTLTLPLERSDTGEYTCTVCIDVPGAGIDSYCSNATVNISSESEC